MRGNPFSFRGRRRRLFPGWGRRRTSASSLAIIAALVIFLWLREGTRFDPAPGPGAPAPGTSAPARSGAVARVDDGDTITLENGTRVRYLGIDTPERGEPLHAEARAANRRLVEGREVEVQVGPEGMDRHGRVLGMVHVRPPPPASPFCVNTELVRAGLAWVYIVNPDSIPLSDLPALLDAQRHAIAAGKGVWPRRLEAARRGGEALVATRFRIHRASCPEIRKATPRPVRSLASELGEGRSLCRSCRPLE